MMNGYNLVDMLLTPNRYSRPQKKLDKIKGIVIHWVANPNTTAEANRNFFEGRKNGGSGYGSAHEIVGLTGRIVRCIPEDEVAYHVGSESYTNEALDCLCSYPNGCTYGIECTHIDWDGTMTEETYNALLQRCINLCRKWDLNPVKDLWLHYEVVGWKDCHRWFVNNPGEWKKFKQLVKEGMIDVELKKWQKEIGIEAVDSLNEKGLINNPEQWKEKLGEYVPNWLFFVMLDRITKN